MPPKVAAKGGKRGRPPNASRAKNALPAKMPQDLNDELSFEDQSTPKPGTTPGVKTSREPGTSAPQGQEAQPRRRGRPAREQQAANADQEAEPRRATRRTDSHKTRSTRNKDDELADGSTDTPGSANSGRKRQGRLSDNLQDIAEQEENAGETEKAAESAGRRTRKRKRTQEPTGQEPQVAQEAEASEPKKRKRGRPSLNKAQPEPAQATAGGKKRKDKEKDNEEHRQVAVENSSEKEAEPVKKRRGRKPKNQSEPATTAPAAATPSELQPRRRGRPRLSGASEFQQNTEASQPSEPEATEKTNSKKRTRPSPRPSPQPPTEKKKKGRSVRVQEPEPEPEPEEPEGEAEAEPETVPAKKKQLKRKRAGANADTEASERASPSNAEQDGNEPPSPPRNHYRHIAARSNPIPVSTIEQDWAPLDTSTSIPLATSLLTLAERPVLQRLTKNAKRRGHAAFVLRKISQAVTRKLKQQFPFPPALNANGGKAIPSKGTSSRRSARSGSQPRPPADPRDQELDYERVLDAVKSLERSLDSQLHSRHLLEAERKAQEDALEKEYAELDNLEANARSEARGLRDKLKKVHALVPPPEKPQQQQQQQQNGEDDAEPSAPGAAELRLAVDEAHRNSAGNLFGDLADLQLDGLDTQLASHMESLGSNLRPIDGVMTGVVQGAAALRDVLTKHLTREQYEDVVLGHA